MTLLTLAKSDRSAYGYPRYWVPGYVQAERGTTTQPAREMFFPRTRYNVRGWAVPEAMEAAYQVARQIVLPGKEY
eukprot:3787114-Rhodomonas_salina.3